jgi:hypothetical protein
MTLKSLYFWSFWKRYASERRLWARKLVGLSLQKKMVIDYAESSERTYEAGKEGRKSVSKTRMRRRVELRQRAPLAPVAEASLHLVFEGRPERVHQLRWYSHNYTVWFRRKGQYLRGYSTGLCEKRSAYEHEYNSEWLPRYSCFNLARTVR